MRPVVRYVLRGVAAVIAAAGIGLLLFAQSEAHRLVTNPRATRHQATSTPADVHLPCENVTVTTADGLHLVGWYIPGQNHAAIIVQHGYKDSRSTMLGVAALFARHGYGVLIDTVRAHDASDGEVLTFGHLEMLDLDAWDRFLQSRFEVDPDRVGIFGASMGGALAIQFAARTPRMRAVVSDAAYASVGGTIGTSVRFFTGLPPFPFAPLIQFFAEREAGFRTPDVDPVASIGRISPRPVLILQGGADAVIAPDSGARLYAAADEPKQLWFEPTFGHVEFLAKAPAEFERRVVGFFDTYLLKP